MESFTLADGNFGNEFLNEFGKPVERTPLTHPYGFDGYVIWQTDGKPNNTIYTDRLFQWDYEKYNKLCEKHFGDKGQNWDRDPDKIEAFLQDYTGKKKLKLIRIMKYCNQSSGYPVWRLDTKEDIE